jgi:hypothetical protein
MLAMRLALERQILGVSDQLQMVRIPAGIDATPMVKLHAVGYRAA